MGAGSGASGRPASSSSTAARAAGRCSRKGRVRECFSPARSEAEARIRARARDRWRSPARSGHRARLSRARTAARWPCARARGGPTAARDCEGPALSRTSSSSLGKPSPRNSSSNACNSLAHARAAARAASADPLTEPVHDQRSLAKPAHGERSCWRCGTGASSRSRFCSIAARSCRPRESGRHVLVRRRRRRLSRHAAANN